MKNLAASYSSTLLCAVPSAMKGLTSEFGMGSGVPLSPLPPRKNLEHIKLSIKAFSLQNAAFELFSMLYRHRRHRGVYNADSKRKKMTKSMERLVLVSSTYCYAYTPSLSTM